MKVLITGGGGQLGREVARVTREAGAEVSALTRRDLDILNTAMLDPILDRIRPDALIHTAAWTDVDACEGNPELAYRINGESTRELALRAADRNILFVYVSTDFVFDGLKKSPYEPNDQPRPINQYGRSKWMGEQAVLSATETYYIVRTSWVFGTWGRNFPKAILEAARDGKPLRVVNDQIGSPTYADDLARAISTLLGLVAVRPSQCEGRGRQVPIPFGVYHVANRGETSRFEFAKAILKEAAWRAPLTPISSEVAGGIAPRPKYSVLGSGALQLVGVRLPSWQAALQRFLNRLRVAQPDLFP